MLSLPPNPTKFPLTDIHQDLQVTSFSIVLQTKGPALQTVEVASPESHCSNRPKANLSLPPLLPHLSPSPCIPSLLEETGLELMVTYC